MMQKDPTKIAYPALKGDTLGIKDKKESEITTQVAATSLEDRHKKDELDIDGVFEITLSKETQKEIGIQTWDKIIPEVSWTHTSKELLEKNIKIHGSESDFYNFAEYFKNFSGSEFLIGIVNTIEEVKFYLCLTNEAEKCAVTVLEKKKRELEERLENAIIKQIKPWHSLGSEKEVDDTLVRSVRPLVEKEIVISVAGGPAEVHFKDEDPKSLKFGYVEFASIDDYKNVVRRRYSQGVQACPSVKSSSAQTNPGFPTNIWTQYEYEVKADDSVLKQSILQNIKSFRYCINKTEDKIKYNDKIDLCTNDYPELILNQDDTQTPEKILYEDYESFLDIENCQGMMISCAVWHPFFSGIVAIAYVRRTRSLFVRNSCTEVEESDDAVDDVTDAVYTRNYVLIWSNEDRFKPKFLLETPREVHCLQFSPGGGNILIGGLKNGQIVVWDIGKKLEDIQKPVSSDFSEHSMRFLSVEAHLGWMKEKKSDAYVSPAAISPLQFSHTACVTGVKWIAPFWNITATGHIEPVRGREKSQLFLSCAEDGCVYVWNLKASKLDAQSMVKHQRKSKIRDSHFCEQTGFQNALRKPFLQIFTRYPGLTEFDKDVDSLPRRVPLSTMDIVPVGKPRRKDIEVAESKEEFSLMDLGKSSEESDLEASSPQTSYSRTTLSAKRKLRRVMKPEIKLGTLEGVYATLSWQERDPESEQTSGPLTNSFSTWGAVHDGPVTSLARSPFLNDLILSVGGKIFALWIEAMKDTPLCTKRCHTLISSGCWSLQMPNMFLISYIDGTIEFWDLLKQSHKASFTQNISGELITGMFPHSAFPSKCVLAVADFDASFRLFSVPRQHAKADEELIQQLHHLIEREMSCKEAAFCWRKNWEVKNAELLRARKEAAEIEAKRKEELEREKIRKLREETKKKQQALEARKKRLAEARAKAFTWKQDAEKRWYQKEKDHLISTLLKQKKLDKEKLYRIQEPYAEFLKQEEAKKKKLQEKLGQKQSLYEAAVKELLPEIPGKTSEESPSENKDDLLQGIPLLTVVEDYAAVERETLRYIEEHPYELTFSWSFFMKEAEERGENTLEEFLRLYYLSLKSQGQAGKEETELIS